jgi:hypothetical protein
MSGYGNRKGLSQGVHDPLSARVIAFEHAGHRLVLVSADILGFYGTTAEVIRNAIQQTCALKPEELLLCGTHTHGGPTVTFNPESAHSNNLEYTKLLQEKLIGSVRTALSQLAPVRIGVGSGWSPVGVNRREVVRDNAGNDTIRLGRNPPGPMDREVQVMKITRSNDGNELLSALFAYATHSTCLGGQNTTITGDVHGQAEQFVERYLGAGIVVPGFAGASGNVDPVFRVRPGFKTENGWIPEPVLLGAMLGEEVVSTLDKIKTSTSNTVVRGIFKTVSLPGKTMDKASSTNDVPPKDFNFSVARVGDIAFVGLSGEVFNEIGQAIKSASPFPHTFIFTHCNGDFGYVPTTQAYAEGGYEVQTSPFAPGVSERMQTEVVALLNELKRMP